MSWYDQIVFGDTSVLDLIIFVIVVITAIVVARIISQLIRNRMDEKMGLRFSKSLARMAFYTIVGLTILIGFSKILHVQFEVLIISLGVVGVAIAFASQQVISNLISGIMISITRTIQLEDWVEVGGAPNTAIARVTDINLMNTMLRDVDGRIVIVPNSQIINGKIINYNRAGFVAVSMDLWLDASSDMRTVRRIVNEEADRDPHILPRVTEEERRMALKILERPSIKRIWASEGDLSRLVPQVDIVDLRKDKVKISIKVWLRLVQRKDEILSDFLEALRARFQEANIGFRDP